MIIFIKKLLPMGITSQLLFSMVFLLFPEMLILQVSRGKGVLLMRMMRRRTIRERESEYNFSVAT
ncbi:hypothetical protein EUTSA_v10011933mg [Eutrema salsugineum]|uniref:Uncharacterized protein n=1 Tax=Eutrema salsugineum TaxID=72664 RepID=V4MH64_EUTSA|nr:hypothetical protein EUTSA_v10011933mg [Eutrema salsugineum]